MKDAYPISVTACPACGASEFSPVATWQDWVAACAGRPDGPMRLEAAEACGVAAQAPAMKACDACNSVTMDPIPHQEQLNGFYHHYHATDDFLAKANKKVLRAMKRILPFRVLTGGRFLETGGSIGTAAEAARRLGFTAVSQEIDEKAVEIGRELFDKVEFVTGYIDALEGQMPFNMVYCAEVIEHCADPLAFAHALHSLTAPGGWLFLTTPDAGHSRRPEPFINWKSVKPPEHIVLFTKEGLREMFSRAGYGSIFFLPHPKPGVRMIARRNRR